MFDPTRIIISFADIFYCSEEKTEVDWKNFWLMQTMKHGTSWFQIFAPCNKDIQFSRQKYLFARI